MNPKVSDHENSELHINNLEKWKTLEARLLQNKTIDAAHQDVMEREKKKWRDILHRLLDITLFWQSRICLFEATGKTLLLKTVVISWNLSASFQTMTLF